MDPEALVQCPYDKSHQVRVSRLPYHLVKCQRNNPRVARTLATCPFNARHRVPQAELRSHVISCPDKRQPDLPHEMGAPLNNGLKQPEVPTAWQGPPCQEDWEAELEDLEDPPPFILHVRTNDLLLPCDSSAPAAPTSHSGSKGAAGHPAHPLAPPAPPSRRPQPPLNSGSDVNSDEEDDRDRTGSSQMSPGAGGPHGAPAAPGDEEADGFGASSFMCASNRANNGLATLAGSFSSEGGSGRLIGIPPSR
ncbi:gametocyte-specific factor 1 [Grus japonensis]|uniref:Gametocyte-specific factor 1 n=1 Tax=Grus japonensis TaxID=30415 RepID=A0ABC9XVI9_GRUJA